MLVLGLVHGASRACHSRSSEAAPARQSLPQRDQKYCPEQGDEEARLPVQPARPPMMIQIRIASPAFISWWLYSPETSRPLDQRSSRTSGSRYVAVVVGRFATTRLPAALRQHLSYL